MNNVHLSYKHRGILSAVDNLPVHRTIVHGSDGTYILPVDGENLVHMPGMSHRCSIVGTSLHLINVCRPSVGQPDGGDDDKAQPDD